MCVQQRGARTTFWLLFPDVRSPRSHWPKASVPACDTCTLGRDRRQRQLSLLLEQVLVRQTTVYTLLRAVTTRCDGDSARYTLSRGKARMATAAAEEERHGQPRPARHLSLWEPEALHSTLPLLIASLSLCRCVVSQTGGLTSMRDCGCATGCSATTTQTSSRHVSDTTQRPHNSHGQ